MNREILTSKILFIVIVLFALALLAKGISMKTRSSVAPPVYDPISYYYKSAYVWHCLAKGKFSGTLNGPYAIRPPGTALILYPFGFKIGIKSFLFRSVFAPVALWGLALALLISPGVRRRPDAIVGGSLVAGLLSMPVFFHFQSVNEIIGSLYPGICSISAQWGLMDSLEATVAAVALGLVWNGVRRTSLPLSLAGWIIGAYTLFIKPSGMLVMLSLLGIAMVELIIKYLGEKGTRRSILKFGAVNLLMGLLISSAALWIAIHSDYLGHETIASAKISQAILVEMKRGLKLGPLLYLFIQPVIGWWWFCPIVLFLGLFILKAIRSLTKKEIPAIGLRLAFAALVAVASIYWWLNLAGTEHRYLYPFLLMLIGWFLPDVFAQIGRLTAPLKSGVAIYCIIPFSVLLGMLHSSHPNLGLQNAMGVCLITDCYKEEVKQGKWLMAQSAKLGRPLNLYAVNTGEPNGVIEMTSLIYGIEHGFGPNQFIVYRANSWTSNPGIRMDDFLKSDFILLGKEQPVSPHGDAREISDWMEEELCFNRFIHSICAGEQHGLEFVSEGKLKLLRISDPQKLGEAIHGWAQSIQWKNDFIERNRAFLEKAADMDVTRSGP